MSKAKKLFRHMQPKLLDLTLDETAELAGLVLNESNFHLNDTILDSFIQQIDLDRFTGYLCKGM